YSVCGVRSLFDNIPNTKSEQFYQYLKNELLNGVYKNDERFPSIRELSKKYKLSSITVSTVISNLIRENLLYSKHGSGTFVGKLNKRDNQIKMIGTILFNFKEFNDVEMGIYDGIQQTLTSEYFTIPYNTYDDIDRFYKGLKGFGEMDVSGLIICPPLRD